MPPLGECGKRWMSPEEKHRRRRRQSWTIAKEQPGEETDKSEDVKVITEDFPWFAPEVAAGWMRQRWAPIGKRMPEYVDNIDYYDGEQSYMRKWQFPGS